MARRCIKQTGRPVGGKRFFLEASLGEAGREATICGAVQAKEPEWVPDLSKLPWTMPLPLLAASALDASVLREVRLCHLRHSQHPCHRCQHAHLDLLPPFPAVPPRQSPRPRQAPRPRPVPRPRPSTHAPRQYTPDSSALTWTGASAPLPIPAAPTPQNPACSRGPRLCISTTPGSTHQRRQRAHVDAPLHLCHSLQHPAPPSPLQLQPMNDRP